MNLQVFFESVTGKVAAVMMIVGLLALVFFTAPKKEGGNSDKIRTLAVCAVLMALTFIANNYLRLYRMPQGGSITLFSMMFMFLIGYIFGPRTGILAGLAYGVLDFLLSVWAIHPIQILLDYPLAFAMLGLGGILRNKKHGLYTGYALGVFGRYITVVLAGFLFYSANAPEGFSVAVYVFGYNLIYIGAEALLSLGVMAVPAVRNTIQKIAQFYNPKKADTV